jgi:acyl-CoA reductase-like NAD-dependent aldehyde dehydrogenase
VCRFAHCSLDPATGEELGTVPEMGIEETKEAIDAAGRSFVTWSKTTAKVMGRHPETCYHLTWGRQQRHDILMKFYNLMKEHEDDLARIIVGPCIFVINACLYPRTDPREWKDLCRSKGRYQ